MSGLSTLQNILGSFVPVAVKVVPLRALSFGVFNLSQDIMESTGFFHNLITKTASAAMSGLSLAALPPPAEIVKTRKRLI